MRAVLTNFGTTGSVQPYIALAMELKRHKHEPVLALSPYFAPRVEQLGLSFSPVGPNMESLQRAINTALLTSADSMEQWYSLFAPLLPALPQMFDELRDACRDADVLISGPMQPVSRIIHEMTSLPFVTVQNAQLGGGGSLSFQQASASLINPFREQLGLPPLRSMTTMDADSPQLVIYAMSRHVRPPSLDWPPYYHLTGYFFLDEEEWQPTPELDEFIRAGGPPVVISFGSMTHDDPEAMTDLVLEAIAQVGCRAVIQHGWSGLAQRNLPPNLHATGFVPHAWLFPRASCVVHHGGSGTTAAVFRAGVPHVFVPHTWDQPMWAELGEGLGCAGPSIPYTQLNAKRLATALTNTLNHSHYRQAAAELGEKVRAEEGVKKARRLIEGLVQKIGLHEEQEPFVNDSLAQAESRQERSLRRKQYQQKQRSRKREAGA
jgi:Glycosyl transferases, related to UDP-glucuronosyltransferase